MFCCVVCLIGFHGNDTRWTHNKNIKNLKGNCHCKYVHHISGSDTYKQLSHIYTYTIVKQYYNNACQICMFFVLFCSGLVKYSLLLLVVAVVVFWFVLNCCCFGELFCFALFVVFLCLLFVVVVVGWLDGWVICWLVRSYVR